MKNLNMSRGLVTVAACLFTSFALADTGSVVGFVKRTLVSDDGRWGGCMALLSEDISDSLPACNRSWVTFSCDGTYTDPVRAYRMLDQAQLALATGMSVVVFVDDSRKHNNYCFASRIDLLSY